MSTARWLIKPSNPSGPKKPCPPARGTLTISRSRSISLAMSCELLHQDVGLPHRRRDVEGHAVTVGPEDAVEGQAGGLADQVPQRDVDPTDQVGGRPAADSARHQRPQTFDVERVLSEQ